MEKKNDVERLAALFTGFASAHGTHGVPTREPESLKWIIKTTAKTLRQSVTIELWEKHVAGERPLGVIPIREDCSCSWGSIDFDEYDVDLLELIRKVEAFKYPLVPCRSKSGGLHLFLFLTQPEPADRVQAVLRNMAASLGVGDSEIFPKQTKILTERGDFGNWMVMPYFGGDFGGKLKMQHGLKKTGAEMLLSEFLKHAESRLSSLDDLETVVVERRNAGSKAAPGTRKKGGGKGDFSDGPPCLQHLFGGEVQSDGRKRTLFHSAIYFKRACPDDWKERLEKANQRFGPPLPSSEVLGIINSLEKKDYEYTCKAEPMKSHCDSVLCRMRKFGVGNGGEYPSISSMRKMATEPPVWFLEVDGNALEFTTDDLLNYMRFQKICMDKISKTYKPIKHEVWLSMVAQAMDNMGDPIEPPPDIGEDKEFYEHLEEYLTNRAAGKRLEDLKLNKPFHDTENRQYLFSLAGLKAYLRAAGVKDINGHKIRAWLTAIGGEIAQVRVSGSNKKFRRVPESAIEARGDIQPPQLEREKI